MVKTDFDGTFWGSQKDTADTVAKRHTKPKKERQWKVQVYRILIKRLLGFVQGVLT